MLDGKKVLVTGAGGFIGSHLAEALVIRGAEVTCLIRYGSSPSWGNLEFTPPEVKSQFKVLAGDVQDPDFIMLALAGQDIVLHLAALITIPYSYLAPRSYLRTNAEGTLNVLEAARRLGTGRVVHTSTSEVYGTAIQTPINEEHPLQGQSPYSASKIGADKIAESYYRSFNTPVVTLRPFNTFGPRQSARAFIPTIISQALERSEIHLGALDPQRDMTYVSDTVDGFIAAATQPDIEGEVINLGTGETFSIGEVAAKILGLMGIDKPIRHDATRVRPGKSEVLKLVSDNRKAHELMNWSPRIPLDDGLRASIAFIEQNRHLFRPASYTI